MLNLAAHIPADESYSALPRAGGHHGREHDPSYDICQPGDLLEGCELSVPCATLESVEVTEHDVRRIPLRNLRVPLEEFVAVWAEAEQVAAQQAEQRVTDWYIGGVVVTCQWIARAVVRPSAGPRRLARSPVSRRTTAAYEELLEAEYLAAGVLDDRRPDLLEHRPGWCEGIVATLRWAWRHSGPPPIDVAARDDRTYEPSSTGHHAGVPIDASS
jgi:hypothetical protein